MVSMERFWNFISHNKPYWFELRIKDYTFIKEVGEKWKFPYSASGVYVNNYKDLMRVMMNVRKKCTVWISVNPKRKSFNNKLDFKAFNGTDASIDSIANLMIDIDRKVKNGAATQKQKKFNLEVSDMVIEFLRKFGFKSYAKIDSGNGIQLLYPLEPLLLQQQEYDKQINEYVLPKDTENYKKLIKLTIGVALNKKFNTKEIEEKYNCEIDSTSFNIGRVMALHGTYNFKYKTPILRECLDIHIEDGLENQGIIDGMIQEFDKIPEVEPGSQYDGKVFDSIGEDTTYNSKTIKQSPLVKLLLSKKLPDGERNSKLIYPLKILIAKNSIPMSDANIFYLKQKIESVQKDKFSFNAPPRYAVFNSNVVNSYCIRHFLPLVYPVHPERKIKRNLENYFDCKETFNFENYTKIYIGKTKEIYGDEWYNKIKLTDYNNPYLDLLALQKIINKEKIGERNDSINESSDLAKIIAIGVDKFVIKYGEEKAKFILENYFQHFFEK